VSGAIAEQNTACSTDARNRHLDEAHGGVLRVPPHRARAHVPGTTSRALTVVNMTLQIPSNTTITKRRAAADTFRRGAS
jgi:hypothetical protein